MLGNEELLFDEIYEKTKDCGRVQFVKLLMTKERENQELKKQVEETEKCLKDMYHINIENDKELDKLKTQLEECKDKINWYENFEVNKTIDQLRLKHNIQQKDFIKYLEDEIESYELTSDLIFNRNKKMKIYKDVLQKYKEIIGVLDDKTN